MYQFITGPLLWLSFAIFFIGIIARVVMYIRGLSWQLDRVAYSEHFSYGMKGAIRSIFYWIIPFGSVGWRKKPGMTFLFFIFHFCLLLTPIFLSAHNILLMEGLGFSLPTLPGGVADLLTIILIIAGVFLVLRRIAFPEVRILTSWYDILMIAITVAPFITGFIAYHSSASANYHEWLIIHILCGEIMLVAIPFTKLSHMVLFFMSRAQLGMDFGIKRGGMKGKGFAW